MLIGEMKLVPGGILLQVILLTELRNDLECLFLVCYRDPFYLGCHNFNPVHLFRQV